MLENPRSTGSSNQSVTWDGAVETTELGAGSDLTSVACADANCVVRKRKTRTTTNAEKNLRGIVQFVRARRRRALTRNYLMTILAMYPIATATAITTPAVMYVRVGFGSVLGDGAVVAGAADVEGTSGVTFAVWGTVT